MSWDKGIEAAVAAARHEAVEQAGQGRYSMNDIVPAAVSAFLGEQPTIQWCSEHQCGDVPEVNVSCIVGTSRDEHERCQIVVCRLVGDRQ